MVFGSNNTIAIIPARGGSKRIPRKNIRLFNEKPIISYSIEAAIQSKIFDEIMVSTDDQEIAEVALKYGAKVPFLRSEKTSNDYATIIDVMDEVLLSYESIGRTFKVVSCIFATAPFLEPTALQKAYDIIKTEDVDGVFSVLKFSFPILRALEKDKDEFLKMKWPEYRNTRSQDLDPAYHDAGQFYFATTIALQESRSFFTRKAKGIELSPWEAIDIDNEDDWIKAEKLFRIKSKSS